MGSGLAFAGIVVVYAFGVLGKFAFEFIKGFTMEPDCWPWPA